MSIFTDAHGLPNIAKPNQSLNTTDQVQFNAVSTSNINTLNTNVDIHVGPPVSAWINAIGDFGSNPNTGQIINDVAHDSQGNIIAIMSSLSNDTPITVLKLTPDGSTIWQRKVWNGHYNGYSNDRFSGGLATVDAQDNIYLFSYSAESYNKFGILTKISPSSNVLWQVRLSAGNMDAIVGGIGVDSSGSAIIGLTHNYGWVSAKVSSSGTPLWVIYADNPYDQRTRCVSVEVDQSNNIFIGYLSTADNLPGVAKLSPSGQVLWDKRFDIPPIPGQQPTPETSLDISITPTGDVSVSIWKVYEDVNNPPALLTNAWLCKVSSDGATLDNIINVMDPGRNGGSVSATYDSDQNVYVSALDESSIGLIIRKISPTGTIAWSRELRCSSQEDYFAGSVNIKEHGGALYVYDAVASWPVDRVGTSVGEGEGVLARLPTDGTGAGTYGWLEYKVDNSLVTLSNTTLTLSDFNGTFDFYDLVANSYDGTLDIIITTANTQPSYWTNTVVGGGVYPNGMPFTFTNSGSLVFASGASVDKTGQITFGSGSSISGSGSNVSLSGNVQLPSQSLIQSSTSPIPINTSDYAVLSVNGHSVNIVISSDTGIPKDGQKFLIRLKDDGTARSITWPTTGKTFRAVGGALPTVTTPGKLVYVECIYNEMDAVWDVVRVTHEI